MMKVITGNRNRLLRALAVLVCAAVVLTAISGVMMAAQGAPQKKMSLPHRSTWDADMIDSDTGDTGYTGAGVYVAVLDTGLAPNWADYLPADSVATELGRGFYESVTYDPKTGQLIENGKVVPTGWIGSISSTHGTHVASTIVGYNYYAPSDAAAGWPLNPVFVEGIAPDAKIIPVKVLFDYSFGKIGKANFGTDRAVAAGIDYVTGLASQGYKPMVISMSLGSDQPSDVIREAIAGAIEEGVIVVAAAGNAGEAGMDWPGAYPEVISVGSCGWRYEWYAPAAVPPPRYRLWWLQDNTYGYRDVTEAMLADDVYVSDFSGRQKPGQELDVLAPGSWVRGPYPGTPGYNHLPWWSEGNPQGRPWMGNNFYYLGGTSMSTPHVSATVAMMLQKNPILTQMDVEDILKSTALDIPSGIMTVYDIDPAIGWYDRSWVAPEATGAGLIQADEAVEAVPTP